MPVSKKRKKKIKVEVNRDEINYICTECGKEEKIPLEVVRNFDEMDQSNINEPPQFFLKNVKD